MVMFPLLPVNVPAACVKLDAPTVSVMPALKDTAPVYPVAIENPRTLAAASIVQEPSPAPLKIAISIFTGTLAPEAPPEVVDQFAVLFQLAAPPEIQKRLAE